MRTAKRWCVWQTWQSYYLRVLSWYIILNINISIYFISTGLSQKDLFKKGWSWAEAYLKENYCHACHTRFAVFFPLPFCCVSSVIKHGRHTRTQKQKLSQVTTRSQNKPGAWTRTHVIGRKEIPKRSSRVKEHFHSRAIFKSLTKTNATHERPRVKLDFHCCVIFMWVRT